ncbi:hypothetical protein [Natribaculum luteum]|uniref:hypothetical protein n=1 Tax=Natribaculum luteum TaxID=1586232 RepID=UPI00367069C4
MPREIISDSLTYLSRSDEAVGTFLIGALLSYFGAFILPLILVAGYNLLVLSRTIEEANSAPPDENGP